MRVIEPHSMRAKRKTKRGKKLVFVVVVIVVATVGFGWLYKNHGNSETKTSSISSDQDTGTHKVAGVQSGGIKYFTGEQFQQLYETLAMPNTQALDKPPSITGSELADKRIVQIAESRGYKLRSVPVFPIIKTNEPGLGEDDLLQPKAYEGWLKLKDLAQKDGVPLKLNSGYRSIDWQRKFFIQRLQASGVSVEQIINGQADSAIASVLHVVAPPGYSRHHTGYTVDFICNDGTGRSFEYTSCFKWIGDNNYDKAKQAGWIPSYPEGVDSQGPEPEPWEYVWVGLENISN